MWQKVKDIKVFTTREEVEKITGAPKCQMRNCPSYYYGNGIFIEYSNTRFKVENMERVEYGEKGEYALNIYHYADIEMVRQEWKMPEFEADDMEAFDDDIIKGKVNYQKTFKEVSEAAKLEEDSSNCTIGQTRIPVDLHNGIWKIAYLWIRWGKYNFQFKGKSKKGKLSAFEYFLLK